MVITTSTLMPVMAFGGACACGFMTWRYGRLARAVADTPTAKVRSAPQGYVELSGRAKIGPDGLLRGPLSGQPCVWFRYRVEKRHSDGKWKVADQGTSDAAFSLSDETGTCLLYPDGAQVMGVRSRRWFGERPPPERSFSSDLVGTLRAVSDWLEGFASAGQRYRYTEQRIQAGDRLHALGWFRTVGGASELPNTRRELSDLLEDWKRDPRRMALFDRNGDGQVDVVEWDAAVKVAEHQLEQDRLSQPLAPELHTMTRPQSAGRPFLVSTQGEASLVQSCRLRTVAAGAGMLVAGGYLVWALG